MMLFHDAPTRNRIAHEDAIAFFRANPQITEITYDNSPEGRTTYTQAVEAFEGRFPDGFPPRGTRQDCQEYLVGFLVLQFNASNPDGPMDRYMRSLLEEVYEIVGIEYTPRLNFDDTLLVPQGSSTSVRRTLRGDGNPNVSNDGATLDGDSKDSGDEASQHRQEDEDNDSDDDDGSDFGGMGRAPTSSRTPRKDSRRRVLVTPPPTQSNPEIRDQSAESSTSATRTHPALPDQAWSPRPASLRRQAPPPAPSSHFASRTCQECRKGHRPCDKRLPKCSLCHRLGKDCVYVGSVDDARKGTGPDRKRKRDDGEAI